MSIRASINPIPWESSFFNHRLGLVWFNESAEVLTPASLNAFSLVQVKVMVPAKMKALGVLGFQLVKREMNCCYTLPPTLAAVGMELPAAEMRLANAADIPALRALAAETLEPSRFRPPWFSNDERHRFHAQWAENAVFGSFDHYCLVTARPNGIAELVT